MDEEVLIDGCMRGEPWARKEVYEIYAPAMMSLCMRYAGERETARDWLQDGFIKVFTKIHTYAHAGAFGGWVRRIFVTTALEHLRKADALRTAADLDDMEELLPDGGADAIDRLSTADLMACVAKLPTGYRTVFNLYAVEGYSHREIGGMLGISEITSRTQFTRARNALQKSVESLMKQEYARLQKAGR